MQNRGNIGDGVGKKKGPMPVDIQKKEWMATAVPARSSPWFMDSDKACEILESLLAQQDEILSLQKENRLFIKYKKVQEEWKQHRIESLQLEQRTEYLRRKHAQQKTRQKHDNQTGPLQQRVDQEISDEQKMDLQLLEKQKTEHAKKGKEIKHRGHLSQCEVYILPERDVVEPKVSPQHNKIFLSAFLRRVREIQRDQEEIACGTKQPGDGDKKGATGGVTGGASGGASGGSSGATTTLREQTNAKEPGIFLLSDLDVGAENMAFQGLGVDEDAPPSKRRRSFTGESISMW
eukprot:jgi/Undpi1/13301/HiC_scaffold_8.g02962.m1